MIGTFFCALAQNEIIFMSVGCGGCCPGTSPQTYRSQANPQSTSLAMLKRRRGETLLQLLTRLDQAIAKTVNEDIFTDEINT